MRQAYYVDSKDKVQVTGIGGIFTIVINDVLVLSFNEEAMAKVTEGLTKVLNDSKLWSKVEETTRDEDN